VFILKNDNSKLKIETQELETKPEPKHSLWAVSLKVQQLSRVNLCTVFFPVNLMLGGKIFSEIPFLSKVEANV